MLKPIHSSKQAPIYRSLLPKIKSVLLFSSKDRVRLISSNKKASEEAFLDLQISHLYNLLTSSVQHAEVALYNLMAAHHL
jgi:hypothetical protein